MTPDYRSERLGPEGKGRARQAWETYAKGVGKAAKPVLGPASNMVAREWMLDLLGFWMLWHLYGGFEGLERFGFHRSTIYRKISRFRQTFGAHPDEFEFPGVTIDPEAYWAAAKRQVGPKPKS
jgi:hypothetical protein